MARVRSPNYPQLSLPEAISRIKTIHEREQHLAAPKDVIAKHLGYGGLNGASIKVLSALGKYGLLEEVSGDKVKVSQAAISILYPQKPEEKASAIKEAAFKPPLFAEIFEEWQGAQPSDENLRAYLVRRNFASDALDRVIQSYRETMELVTRESGGYSPPAVTANQQLPPLGGAVRMHAQPLAPTGGGLVPNPPRAGATSLTIEDDHIEVSATLLFQENIEDLIAKLQAVKVLRPRAADLSKKSPEEKETE